MAYDPDTEGQRKFALSLVHAACLTLRREGELTEQQELQAKRQLQWALRRGSELGFKAAIEDAIKVNRITIS